MTEYVFKEPVQARGRNPFKADAVMIELRKERTGQFVYIDNRVGSTGAYNMGWVCVPGDPALLRQIADKFTAMADELEGRV